MQEHAIDWKAHVLGQANTERHLAVSTKYFMEHLFLEEKTLQQIQRRCEEARIYIDGEGWPSLRVQTATSTEGNKALLGVATDVTNLINSQKRIFNPIWVDSRKSGGISTRSVHQGGYGLLWNAKEALELEKVFHLQDMEGEKGTEGMVNKAKTRNASMTTWWLRVHAVVECKLDEPTDPSEVSTQFRQLVGKLRMVLHSQPNRRFAFGLSLSGSALYVLLADRESIFYTATPINIHEDPLSLICAIAAYSLLSPEQLGYDPTMKIWVPGKEPLHIWEEFLRLEDVKACLYNTHWVMEMPLEHGDPSGRRAQFITISVLYSQRTSTHMTIVWAALDREEMMSKEKTNQIYVLKQHWISSSLSDLVYVCPNNGYSDDLFHSSEVIKTTTADKIAYTMQTIRKSSSTAGIALAVPLLDNKDSPSAPLKAGNEDHASSNVVMKKRKRSAEGDSQQCIASPKASPGRTTHHFIQQRTLLKKLGWPISRAATLLEFISTIKDAVCDHKRLYLGGILHCDVSQGNILIFPKASNVQETRGGLIGFDNAQITKSYIQPTIFRRIDTSWNTKERLEMNKHNLEFEFSSANIELEPDAFYIFEKLMQCDILDNRQAQGWVTFARTMVDILGVKTLSSADLGFHTQNIALPNFKGRDTGQYDHHSVTLPFASPEVLNPIAPLFAQYMRDVTCCHDVVHDLESFVWVMTEHCLLRSGPGGERRPELDPLCEDDFQSTENYQLRELVTLQTEHHYEDYVLCHLHPYFENLKPCLLRLFTLVRTAHFHHLDDIYTPFLRVLGEAEKMLQDLQFPIPPASEKEFALREKALNSLQRFKDDNYDVDHSFDLTVRPYS